MSQLSMQRGDSLWVEPQGVYPLLARSRPRDARIIKKSQLDFLLRNRQVSSKSINTYHLLLVPVIVALCGCVSPKATVESEVLNTKAAALRSVYVATDLALDDAVLAKKLAEEVAAEAKRQGFQVVKSEADAKLVLLPTITRMETRPELASSASPRMRSEPSNQGLVARGADFSLQRPSQPMKREVRTAILITAVPGAAWVAANPDAELPKVWSVLAVTSAAESVSPGSQARMLIQAAGPWFAKSTTEPMQVNLGDARPSKKKAAKPPGT